MSEQQLKTQNNAYKLQNCSFLSSLTGREREEKKKPKIIANQSLTEYSIYNEGSSELWNGLLGIPLNEKKNDPVKWIRMH